MVASTEYLLFGTMDAVDCGSFYDDGVPLELIDLSSPFKAKLVRALCKRACAYDAMNSGFWARHRSLKGHNFDWIKPRVLYKGARRLQEELEVSGNILGMTFELSLSDKSFEGKDYKMGIVGKVDIITIEMPSRFKTSRKTSGAPHWHVRNPFADEFCEMKKTLWEIKFTESLTNAHVIQTAIYAWMYAQVSVSKKPPDRTFLFNVQTGQKLEIRTKRQQSQAGNGAGDGENELQDFMEELIWRKYLVEEKLDDEAFVEQCKKTRQAAINAVEKGVKRERRTGRVGFFGVTPSIIIEDEDRERYDAGGQ